MKRKLLLLSLCLGATCSFAQKKTMIFDGPSFSPGAWNAADLRFSDYEGRHFPFIPDDIYDSHATLIFDISDCSEDADFKVMNGWWSATYYDHVKVYDEIGSKSEGLWRLPITEQMAQDCARRHGGKDLNLLLYSGRCTINQVYTIEDETTAILNLGADGNLEQMPADAIYDLYGRQLSAPKKGQLNIINGRIVMGN